MSNDRIELIQNSLNTISEPQQNIDKASISKDDVETIGYVLKTYLHKMKSHTMYNIIKQEVEQGFAHCDFINNPAYSLPATVNKSTRKVVVNISYFQKSDVSNISATDLYAVLAYGFVFLYFTYKPVDKNMDRPMCDFICSVLIKMFAKKYALVGTFTYEIPRLRYIVNYYVLKKFFDYDAKECDIKAQLFQNFNNTKEDKINCEQFDGMNSIKEMINCLDHYDIFRGMTVYFFAQSVLKSFGIPTLAAFELPQRLLATLVACDCNSKIFPSYFMGMNSQIYNQINNYIQKKVG